MSGDFLSKRLNERSEQGALRKLSPENNLVDLSSNDYLGFARSSELAGMAAVEFEKAGLKYSIGSTGSRLLTGNTDYVESLESFVAAHHRAEAGLIFGSGYAANAGLLSSVAQKGDVILYDELSHASIYDGVRLSKGETFPFRHNDTVHLKERLKFIRSTVGSGQIFVVIESVYSMDGDFAPIIEIAELCADFNANLIVDEAHATGIFGDQGEGKVVELGLEDQVFARVHTFGKALGCHGAAVLGSKVLREYLINFARTFIYTTALPLHSLAAIRSAYELLKKSNDKILNINKLIHLFISKVEHSGMKGFIKSFSPIQCMVVPGNEAVKHLAFQVREDGFDVRPILSPTVPKGKERIRICLHVFNTEEQLIKLVDSLKKHMAVSAENIVARS